MGWIAYLDIGVTDQRLDIGWHWLGRSLSGTYATVEMHLLLVQHAFNDLGFTRVQWQLDDLDRAGHITMLQIGAEREGLLRRHLETAGRHMARHRPVRASRSEPLHTRRPGTGTGHAGDCARPQVLARGGVPSGGPTADPDSPAGYR